MHLVLPVLSLLGWWPSSRFELQFSVSVSTAQQDSVVGSLGSYPTMVTGLGTVGVVLRAPKRYRALFTSPLADPLPADDAE